MGLGKKPPPFYSFVYESSPPLVERWLQSLMGGKVHKSHASIEHRMERASSSPATFANCMNTFVGCFAFFAFSIWLISAQRQ
jgi:hypothetical protein